jgi:hypothetical protein
MAAAAVAGALIFLGIAAFQVALAAGAPWGAYAWGGQREGVLPRGFRIGSAVSAVVWIGAAILLLDAGGFIDPWPDATVELLLRVLAGFLALGVVMNAVSRSRRERWTFTPVTAVALACVVLVLLG